MTLLVASACAAWLLLAAPLQESTDPLDPHGDQFAAVAARMGGLLGWRMRSADVEAARSAVADVGALRLREADASLLELLGRVARGETGGEDVATDALARETFDLAREFDLRFEPELLAALWASPRFRSREGAVASEALDDSDANAELLGRILDERREWEKWGDVADQATRNQYQAARDGKAAWLVAALLPSARSRIVVRDSTRPEKPYVMDEEPPAGLLATECLERLASWRSREGDVERGSIAQPFVVDAAGLDAAALERAVAAARELQVERWIGLREVLAKSPSKERDRFEELPIGARIELVDERGLMPATEAVAPPPRIAIATLPPFPRPAPSQPRDREVRALRSEWIALARAELESQEMRLVAWGAFHAADRALVELAPEIESAIARTGRALVALQPKPVPSDARFAGREPLAAGWATLDAALLLGLAVAPDAVEPWWEPRFHGVPAALLLATRAPDRFADTLLARHGATWESGEWHLWCRTTARSGRPDAFEQLLDLVEIAVDVAIHVGGRQPNRRTFGIGCGSGRIAIPDGFPPIRVWELRGGPGPGSSAVPVELAALGARWHGDSMNRLPRHPREVDFSFSTAWGCRERDRELLLALGAEPDAIAGERERDLDFVDAASFRSAREAMVQADAARWRALLDALVAAGRIRSADGERWPPPYHYQERVLGSERSLEALLGGR